MNKLHQLSSEQAGRFTGITNAIFALLVVAGLCQIALCFQASAGLVARDNPIAPSASPAYITNAPVAHDASVPKNEKS